MRELPKHQLNPKIKNVWRLSDFVWITIVFACFGIPFGLIAAVDHASWAFVALVVSAVLYAVALIVWIGVLPSVRYARWRYELSDDYLEIARGIVWRKRFVIPFIRVQNTDTRQGPIMRAFGLASATVATAAGEHVIPGLESEVAEQLRDKAAELARLAREDV